MDASKKRCAWATNMPDYYQAYHDQVWGVPQHQDLDLFKWLVLESFHVGLSWRLVLSKEANFARALEGYDYGRIAQYQEEDIERLAQDAGIIRHRGKIRATIANAQAFLKVQAEWGSFDAYIWHFTEGQVLFPPPGERPTRSDLSDRITKDLKKRGFKFLGSVTVYSYLQAIGLVNDHEPECFCYQAVR